MILLPTLLENVDKRTLLRMQEIIIDVDNDATADLVRGSEVRPEVLHKFKDIPWVVEVTFSNGLYRIYKVDHVFNAKSFTARVLRSAPSSYAGVAASLMSKLKAEFYVTGDVKMIAQVYKSEAVYHEYMKVHSKSMKAMNSNLTTDKKPTPLAGLKHWYQTTYRKLRGEHALPPIIGVKLMPKINNFEVRCVKTSYYNSVYSPADEDLQVTTVADAVATINRLLSSL